MRSFLLSILTWLFVSPVSGQYLFDNLKPRDGLSTREIRSLYQDSEGFMWMGAMNGLNRFDGNHFLLWNRATHDYPAGLGETVMAITEHGKGQIWFGTTQGVGVLDKFTRSIREVDVQAPKRKANQRVFASQFQTDKQDRLWMGSYNGIFIEDKGMFRLASEFYPSAKQLDDIVVYHGGFFYDSIRNAIWIASTKGMYVLDIDKKQLYSESNNPLQWPLTSHVLNSVTIDREGILWYSDISVETLFSYNFKTKKSQAITAINDDPIWRLKDACNTLFSDRQGRLWVSTWLYSAFVKEPNGVFRNIKYNQNLPYSIGYGFFNDAIQDSYGNVWLATINGVSKLSASNFVEDIIKTVSYPFYLNFDFASVNFLETDDKDGSWWLGKMEGIVHYDTLTKKFERFAPSMENLRLNELFSVEQINGEWWCATSQGISIFNPITKKFHSLNIPMQSGPGKVTDWIHLDKKGFVWFNQRGEGVYRYDPAKSTMIRFDSSTNREWGNFAATNSAFLQEMTDGRLLVGNGRAGIRIFDQATSRFEKFKSAESDGHYIISAIEDKKGRIWASSKERGILELDRDGRILDSVTTKDGLPGANFSDLCVDSLGRLWAISREALICIQTSNKQVTQLKLDVTFSFNDHWNSLVLKGNRLYGTMLDNIVVINIEKFQQSPNKVAPLIAGFKVFKEDVPYAAGKEIKLDYNQNFFSIDFSSPFHRDALSIQYAYMLEGFDKDWVYCGTQQTAAYTNVPHGQYKFLVKSTDGGNNWMSSSTLLSISINPPFWKTGWFIAMVSVLICVLLYWLYERQQRRISKKNIGNTIDYFANSVYGDNSVNEICWDIARNCISQLQFEDCVVYLLDSKTNRLVQKAAYGPKNPKGHELVDPIEIDPGHGIVGAVALSGKPLVINDTSKDSRYIVDDIRRYSELAVPILHDNKVIGIIDSEHRKKGFFTQEHVKALTTIASISANKISEAQAEDYAKENELKLMEINKLLAETQLMALRAQMNPHFVFNCLNSIQECIVTQKYGEASKYLNKFSKLFRMVLNNSGRNLVLLEEEKEVLELYLELEQMRFENSFNYEMLMDEELETDEILLPSMLIQPYVENALWHGLMHKDGERKLSIKFTRLSEEVFQVLIDDNGIGRQKSFEQKVQQSKAKRHESKGLKISKDRMDVLEKQGFHARLEIIDKQDAAGVATGTQVVLELSTFLKN